MPQQPRAGVLRSSARRVGRVLARVGASLIAIVSAVGLVFSGLLLVLAGVLVLQQALQRLLNFDVKLGDMLDVTSRLFGGLARATSSR